jgi:hypothetical protein
MSAITRIIETMFGSRPPKAPVYTTLGPPMTLPAGMTINAVGNVVLSADSKPSLPLPRRKAREVFTCWRWWRCVMRDGEPLLQSTYKDSLWKGPIMRADEKPSVENVAGCHGFFVFAAPVVGCDDGAGVAISPWSSLFAAAKGSGFYPIAGEIELFGTCVVHESGVRGEVARVKRLLVYPRHMPFCRPETITQLADRYDCPVEVGVWYNPAEEAKESEEREEAKTVGLLIKDSHNVNLSGCAINLGGKHK